MLHPAHILGKEHIEVGPDRGGNPPALEFSLHVTTNVGSNPTQPGFWAQVKRSKMPRFGHTAITRPTLPPYKWDEGKGIALDPFHLGDQAQNPG